MYYTDYTRIVKIWAFISPSLNLMQYAKTLTSTSAKKMMPCIQQQGKSRYKNFDDDLSYEPRKDVSFGFAPHNTMRY